MKAPVMTLSEPQSSDCANMIGQWINQSRNGDRDAFAHLVRQYQGMVSGIALSRTGDIHQSEDLAQETFLLAWRKLPELDDVRKFPGWLCSIS